MSKSDWILVPIAAALWASSCADKRSLTVDTDSRSDSKTVDARVADSKSADRGVTDAATIRDGIVDSRPPTPCSPTPLVVQGKDGLVARLNALAWEYVGSYTSIQLSVSDDIALTTALIVEGKDVALPTDCMNRTDCRKEISFLFKTGLPGVTCNGRDDSYNLCTSVTINPGTLRFQAILQDTHPSEYNFTPIINILPACSTPCAPDEIRCAANNTCWNASSLSSYCQLCLAEDKQTCACQTPSGNASDGTDCMFSVSGDVMCSGKCEGGRCKYTGTPGWAGCP